MKGKQMDESAKRTRDAEAFHEINDAADFFSNCGDNARAGRLYAYATLYESMAMQNAALVETLNHMLPMRREVPLKSATFTYEDGKTDALPLEMVEAARALLARISGSWAVPRN